jgi:hypothetical protein
MYINTREYIIDFSFSLWLIVNVDSVLQLLRSVDMVNVADVSEVYAAATFRGTQGQNQHL